MKIAVSIILIIILAVGGYLIYEKYYSKPTQPLLSEAPSGDSAAPKERPQFADSNTQYYIWRVQDVKPADLVEQAKTAGEIIKNNDYTAAVNLMPAINKCEPAFAEMRKAITAPENIDSDDYRPERPVPNLVTAQNIQKMLAVKGMALEKQGNLAGALDAYLFGAQYGGIYAGKNCILIGKLIGIACEKIAYGRLKQFVINHPEDPAQMKRIISTLEKIEQNRTPVSEGFKSEKKMGEYVLDHRKEYAKTEMFSDKETDKIWKNLTEADMQRIRSESDKVWGLVISAAESPYPSKQYNLEAEVKEMIKPMHPIIRATIPNFFHANVRELTVETDNRLVRIMAALQLYYADKKEYPNSLADLTPNYLTSVPKDYFSDSEFIYGVRDNSFYLYSVGPDMQDDKTQVTYDPTNGTISPGDILGK
jgi:hypothetical protein